MSFITEGGFPFFSYRFFFFYGVSNAVRFSPDPSGLLMGRSLGGEGGLGTVFLLFYLLPPESLLLPPFSLSPSKKLGLTTVVP